MNRRIEKLIYNDLKDINAKVNSIDQSLLSVERRKNIYHYLSLTLANGIAGDVIELGVYTGMTAVLLQETLNQYSSKKPLSLFDSFEGIPSSTYQQEKSREGVFSNHPRGDIQEIVWENFKSRDLKQPKIIKGWICRELLESRLPEIICFCHLDVDMYESTKTSLNVIYPRLPKGGIVIIDDYNHPSWRGVRAAVDEFSRDKDLLVYDLNLKSCISDHQGVIIKSI